MTNPKSAQKPTTITNGAYHYRILFGFVSFLFTSNGIGGSTNVPQDIFFGLLFGLIAFLLHISRRVKFTETEIIRFYGRRQKVTPFEKIVSIKRSRTKVNNVRLWKVDYLDKDGLAKKFRFKEGTFQHGSTKEMIKMAEAVNPEIVVWYHPYFNRPPEKEKKED